MILVYCPEGSDCQKARKWLEDNKVSFVSRDVTKEKLTRDEINMWQTNSGLPLKEFYNTSKSNHRNLNSMDENSTMTDDELYRKLTNDSKLLKCPIAVTGTCVLVGFDENKWEKNLI